MVKSHVFTLAGQNKFSQFSGDVNPLHLDESIARRSVYGNCLVHGLHIFLKALDLLAGEEDRFFSIKKAKTRFHSPVFPGETVNFLFKKKENSFKCTAFTKTGEVLKSSFLLEWQNKKCQITDVSEIMPLHPDNLLPDKFQGTEGDVPVNYSATLTKELFPNLYRYCNDLCISHLKDLTYIVGMKLPGLYSLFAAFEMNFKSTGMQHNHLHYQTNNFIKEYSMLEIGVCNDFCSGSITAFHRPLPVQQAAYQEIKKMVKPDSFKTRNVIIIGGSKGLGEAATKIFSAGGATVVLTYFKGEKDARNIVDEITLGGGNAKFFFWDVTNFDETSIMKLPSFDTVLYFATPPLRGGRSFSQGLFHNYCKFFVDAFETLVRIMIKQSSSAKIDFLYASSTAVEELPDGMIEYSLAKAAGEKLCKVLERKYSKIQINCPRLPRMQTDLSASVVPADDVKLPVEELMALFRIYEES